LFYLNPGETYSFNFDKTTHALRTHVINFRNFTRMTVWLSDGHKVIERKYPDGHSEVEIVHNKAR